MNNILASDSITDFVRNTFADGYLSHVDSLIIKDFVEIKLTYLDLAIQSRSFRIIDYILDDLKNKQRTQNFQIQICLSAYYGDLNLIHLFKQNQVKSTTERNIDIYGVVFHRPYSMMYLKPIYFAIAGSQVGIIKYLYATDQILEDEYIICIKFSISLNNVKITDMLFRMCKITSFDLSLLRFVRYHNPEMISVLRKHMGESAFENKEFALLILKEMIDLGNFDLVLLMYDVLTLDIKNSFNLVEYTRSKNTPEYKKFSEELDKKHQNFKKSMMKSRMQTLHARKV